VAAAVQRKKNICCLFIVVTDGNRRRRRITSLKFTMTENELLGSHFWIRNFVHTKILASTCLQYDLCAVDKQQQKFILKVFCPRRRREEEEEATLVK
jgi:hypothetical protein